MITKLKKYLEDNLPNKTFEYKSSGNMITIYINGKLCTDDYSLSIKMIEDGFDLTNIQIHYPEVIIVGDEKYNVNDNIYPYKDKIEFFTIHVKNRKKFR